jgi:UDP:flavonoid glycosyltransferase YjiC (YdhE family)
VSSKEMIIYNYPKELLSHRKHFPNEYYLGAICRKCEINERLEAKLKAICAQNIPIIYVSFGTVFSVRGDALKKIFIALAEINCHVVVAKGVLESEYETYIKEEWTALEFAPQILVLKYSSLLIGHGGNNSIIEALYYGVPIISCPFASDQFFSAASVEENRIGTVIDPNYSTIDEIREAIYVALDCRNNTEKIRQNIMVTRNERRAQQRLVEIISED